MAETNDTAPAVNENQMRGLMMKRARDISNLVLTLDAVIHDAQLLKRQLQEEARAWEQSIELSLQAAEARRRAG